MLSNSNGPECWTLNQYVATVRSGALTARIDVARPQLGLHEIRLHSSPAEFIVDGRLLGILPGGASAWPGRVADAYVRGRDLVATYEAAENWPYASQVYWRAAPTPDSQALAAVSLLVSIQTNLLDTRPRVDVVSQLPAEEVLHLSTTGDGDPRVDAVTDREQVFEPQSNACCLLRRLPGGRFSYAEIMPSSDFRQLSVEQHPGSLSSSNWELFAEFLEKGVIRRARLQLAFLPRENDVQLAAEFCRAINSRPLPLTT